MEESPDRNFDFDPQDTFSPSAATAPAHPAYMIAETAICQCVRVGKNMGRLESPQTPPTRAPLFVNMPRETCPALGVRCRRRSYHYTASSKSDESHVTVSQTSSMEAGVQLSRVLSQAPLQPSAIQVVAEHAYRL
jgi:hypothetical protein